MNRPDHPPVRVVPSLDADDSAAAVSSPARGCAAVGTDADSDAGAVDRAEPSTSGRRPSGTARAGEPPNPWVLGAAGSGRPSALPLIAGLAGAAVAREPDQRRRSAGTSGDADHAARPPARSSGVASAVPGCVAGRADAGRG
jgi:hypothetical protein